MLKRSEYVVMSLSFVFMLAIFLVISINYITDSAASNNEIEDVFDSSTHVADVEKLDKDYLIITGNDDTICENVKLALNYAKKGYRVSYSAYELNANDFKNVKAIIVTTPDLDELGDMLIVMNAVKQRGVDIFFAALPQEGSDNYDAYCEAMGIVSRTGEATIAGFQTFKGLFAQKGDIVCNDYPLTVEDIRIDATCRKYIFEYSPDPNADQSSMVPLLWRTVYGDGQIFILNADFMRSRYSMGLCIAVLGGMESEYAYPIIDAKVNYIDSFPFLSYENGDAMMRFYNRDSQAFIKDQVWPTQTYPRPYSPICCVSSERRASTSASWRCPKAARIIRRISDLPKAISSISRLSAKRWSRASRITGRRVTWPPVSVCRPTILTCTMSLQIQIITAMSG